MKFYSKYFFATDFNDLTTEAFSQSMTSQMDEMTTGETPTTAEGNSMADVIMSMTSQIPNMVTTMLTDRWVSLSYQLAITA